MKKRLGAIILVAAMLLSLFAFSAAATDISEFSDVDTSAWYYEYAKYVVENGYFKGTSVDTPKFEPETTMTRAMFVTVLSRIEAKNTAGFAVDDAATLTFADADAIPDWAAGAVKWAADNKIVEGYPDGTFLPGGHITRAEMAVMIKRYIDYHERKTLVSEKKEAKILPAFKDADQIPEWAAAAAEYCRQQGILIGFEDETLRPNADSTRAQVAAVAQRIDFVANYWTISYDANAAGVAAPAPQQVNKGYSVKLAAAISRAGYTFLGWAFSSTATAPDYVAGADYTPNANVLFYAVWRENAPTPPEETVTITYQAEKPTDKIFEGMKVVVDKAGDLAGKAFGLASDYAEKVEVKVGSWTEDGSRLDLVGASFDYTYGDDSAAIQVPAAQTVKKGSEITVAPALQCNGFTFDGWYDENGDKWEGTKALDKDVTLTAKWAPATEPIEISATVDAELGKDIPEGIIAAAAFVGSVVTSDGREQARDLYYRVEDTVKELVTQYGMYDEQTELWNTAKNTKSIRAVINKAYDLAYDFITEKGPAYWANFKDENGYYFDKMTITVAGQELYADTNSGKGPTNFYTQAGDDRLAAKRIAKQIALDLEEQLKTITAPTDQITLTYEATINFKVNDNGAGSNPNYKFSGTLNLNANGNGQYYWDAAAASHVFIVNVNANDVKAAMTNFINAAAQEVMEDVIKDKVLGETPSSADWMLLSAVGCFPSEHDATITDVEQFLKNHGVDLDAEVESRGLKLSDKPALRDYALAVACDFMNEKALAHGENLAPKVAQNRPEGGWVEYTNTSGVPYDQALLQYLTTEKLGDLGVFLTDEAVLKEIKATDSKILKDLAVYANLIPSSAKLVCDGNVLNKADFKELVQALEANDAKAVVKAIGNLLQKNFVKDTTISDFLTKDATSGGVTGSVTIRGETRNVTLRILDVTP